MAMVELVGAIDLSLLAAIQRGAAALCARAGVAIVGGHFYTLNWSTEMFPQLGSRQYFEFTS